MIFLTCMMPIHRMYLSTGLLAANFPECYASRLSDSREMMEEQTGNYTDVQELKREEFPEYIQENLIEMFLLCYDMF